MADRTIADFARVQSERAPFWLTNSGAISSAAYTLVWAGVITLTQSMTAVYSMSKTEAYRAAAFILDRFEGLR